MALDFDGVANLRIEDVTIPSATIRGPTRNLTIADSRFTGHRGRQHRRHDGGANVGFDGNTHSDIDTCRSCLQGRVQRGRRLRRTVGGRRFAYSLFSGGYSDGVRADANGVRIIGNEFRGLRDKDPFHTDPIQIYGGKRVVIRGNYFHDNEVSAAIMMADGGERNLVEDNVVAARRPDLGDDVVLGRSLDHPPQHVRGRELRLRTALRHHQRRREVRRPARPRHRHPRQRAGRHQQRRRRPGLRRSRPTTT